jgi:allantoin racemase
LELLADLDAATRAIAAAAEAMVAGDGVDTVVLIGAVMAGMAGVVQPALRVPVLEGVSAAVGLAETLVRLRVSPSRAGSYARPPEERVAVLARALGKMSG